MVSVLAAADYSCVVSVASSASFVFPAVTLVVGLEGMKIGTERLSSAEVIWSSRKLKLE